MTESEILQKAIEKAVKNGFKIEMWSPTFTVSLRQSTVWIEYEEGDGEGIDLYRLLFSHEFAKAFFGEEYIEVRYCVAHSKPTKEPFNDPNARMTIEANSRQKAYRAHLQRMVLAENPINYLEKYL